MCFLKSILIGCSCLAVVSAYAQSSNTAQPDIPPEKGFESKEYVMATFKTSRLVSGQSVENMPAGVLDFQIAHRFGALNQGVHNFFGMDNAVTKLSFDYGITNRIMVGIGRSTLNKEYEGFVKIKLLQQTTDNSMPVSLSYAGSVMVQSDQVNLPDSAGYPFSNRVCYANQLLLARKFNSRFSLQLMPTHIHYNLVAVTADHNDVFAIGVGGRVKLVRFLSLNAEYYYTIPGMHLAGYHNALSVGVDIETGGHVFQLHFTNATGLSERAFIGQTTDGWGKGQIHFGFNISRVFTLVQPKGFRKGATNGW
jgi:hypothetical protein